jgi:hypothetical protein
VLIKEDLHLISIISMLSYWVSFLAYPNLFEIKSFVVVVVVANKRRLQTRKTNNHCKRVLHCYPSFSTNKNVHTIPVKNPKVSNCTGLTIGTVLGRNRETYGALGGLASGKNCPGSKKHYSYVQLCCTIMVI